MLIQSVMAYGVVALLFAAHALVRVVRLRPRGGEHIEGADRAVLGATALAASTAWGLLLPLFLLGWLSSPLARAFASGALYRVEVVRLRIAPRRRLRHSAR